MLPKIKNTIIFLVIAIVLILVYIFFIKKPPEEANLVSSNNQAGVNDTDLAPALDKDFLPLLLNVKNIRLDDGIFSDKAFQFLIDSSIELAPEGNEGRINPFAPLGVENTEPRVLSPRTN